MFREGDLVFAKCVKSWPAKIIKVFNQTTFKVDFYNHNSFAIVDEKDLELMSQTNIQYYREKYQKKKNNEEVLALEGIRLAEIQLKRRQELHKIEIKKWSKGIPNTDQKKQFEQKLKKQIKRPVYKPKQSLKKQSQKGQKSQQQNKTQIKTRIKKERKTIATNNQVKLFDEVRTRSRFVKSEIKEPSQAVKKELKDTSKQKTIQGQGGQKDKQKQKKIKKKTKIKKSKKQKKQKKMNVLKQKENKNTSESSGDKTENIPTQDLKTTQEIKEPNVNKSIQNGLQSSSMIVSIKQSPFNQQSPEIAISPSIDQNGRITTKSLNKNNEQPESNQIHSAPILYLHQNNTEGEGNDHFLKIAEQDRIQQSIQQKIQKKIQQQNHGAQSNLILTNKEETDKHVEEINQPITSTNTVQAQNNIQMQIQENIEQEHNEPFHEQKMTVMNNLDLSISSLEISISQENIESNNNPVKMVSPQQTQQQHQTYSQNIYQVNFHTGQHQTQVVQSLQSQKNPIVQEKSSNSQHPQMALVMSDNIHQELQQNQHQMLKINDSSQNHVMQAQMNVQSQNQSISQESFHSYVEKENLQEDENQLQCNQNQHLSKTFQNLAPVTPNLLYQIINHKIPHPSNNDQPSQQIAAEQPQTQVQPSNSVLLQTNQNQNQQLSVNSSIVATNIHTYEVDLKDIQIDSNAPEEIEKSCRYFERIYGDFSINNRDYIKMVRGLPELKKELQNTDCKLMAICVNQYLRILHNFIAPQMSQKQMKNLQMWQRQLLIAILDTDTLNLKILVQYEIMFSMMSFIAAFQQNRTPKRAQCHVQYLFVVCRMDTYLNRYLRQRNKEGLMHKTSSYDQLIRQFNKRVQT